MKEKLEEFSAELQTLLAKYNVRLEVQQGITIVPNQMEENTNVEAPVEVVEETPTQTPEVVEAEVITADEVQTETTE